MAKLKIKDADRISILQVLDQPNKALQARSMVKGGFIPFTPLEFATLELLRDAPVEEVGKYGQFAYETCIERARLAKMAVKKPPFDLRSFDITDTLMLPEGMDPQACLDLMDRSGTVVSSGQKALDDEGSPVEWLSEASEAEDVFLGDDLDIESAVARDVASPSFMNVEPKEAADA